MNNLKKITALAVGQMCSLDAQAASAQAVASQRSEFNVDGGHFSLYRTTLDNSLSLQVIKGHKRGIVTGNSFDEAAIILASGNCVLAAEASQPDEAWDMAGEGGGTFVDGAYEPDMDKLFLRSRELLETIHTDYPKVMVEQMVASHTASRGAYLNSKGVSYFTKSGEYEVWLMFSGHEGDKSSSFNGAGVATDSLDTPFIELGSLRQNLRDAENQIHTAATQGKFEGTVVFTPDCLGGVLQELLGNYTADSVILDGTSQWKDKLGEQVADSRVTVSLRPKDPRTVCGEKYTSEGFLSADYDVIRDGVLRQFMLSLYVANKTGRTRAPNSSQALIMEPGEEALKDIIANVKKGLLVARYSGGNVGANGEFSGVAKNSFIIEDGKITNAVSETMISGNLAGMLNHVVGISRETVDDGRNSLPWLAVSGIIISGN